MPRTRNESDADAFDDRLEQLARRAYGRRETDERWRKVAQHLDAARAVARSMMTKRDKALST